MAVIRVEYNDVFELRSAGFASVGRVGRNGLGFGMIRPRKLLETLCDIIAEVVHTIVKNLRRHIRRTR
jgi:hypothetical protein